MTEKTNEILDFTKLLTFDEYLHDSYDEQGADYKEENSYEDWLVDIKHKSYCEYAQKYGKYLVWACGKNTRSPHPSAVVWPPMKDFVNHPDKSGSDIYRFDMGWNAYGEEFKRLNPNLCKP